MKDQIIIFLEELRLFYNNWNNKAISTFVREKQIPLFMGSYLIKENILIRKKLDNGGKGLYYQYIINKDIKQSSEKIATHFLNAKSKHYQAYNKLRYSKSKSQKNITIDYPTFTDDEKYLILNALIKHDIPKQIIKKIMAL